MPLKDLQANTLVVQSVPGTLVNKGGAPVIFCCAVADGLDADLDYTLPPFTLRVIDAWRVKTNAASAVACTAQVQTAVPVNVTNAMGGNVADGVISRATTLDPVACVFAAGATLRIRRVQGGGGEATCLVYVMAVRTP